MPSDRYEIVLKDNGETVLRIKSRKPDKAKRKFNDDFEALFQTGVEGVR